MKTSILAANFQHWKEAPSERLETRQKHKSTKTLKPLHRDEHKKHLKNKYNTAETDSNVSQQTTQIETNKELSEGSKYTKKLAEINHPVNKYQSQGQLKTPCKLRQIKVGVLPAYLSV